MSLEAESADTAWTSDSNVIYQVLPTSDLTLFGVTTSLENTSVTCSGVASSGTSRTMTVVRSLNGSGNVGTPSDDVVVACDEGDDGVEVVLVVAIVAEVSRSCFLPSSSNLATDEAVGVDAAVGNVLGLIHRPSSLTTTT